MKPEKQQLLNDLLGESEHREATLRAGSRILRRRRVYRVVRNGCLLAAPLLAVMALWPFKKPPSPVIQAATSVARPSAQIEVRALNDDELLALFPGTPVGLATLSDGTKKLIFPRPGDAERFIKRL